MFLLLLNNSMIFCVLDTDIPNMCYVHTNGCGNPNWRTLGALIQYLTKTIIMTYISVYIFLENVIFNSQFVSNLLCETTPSVKCPMFFCW